MEMGLHIVGPGRQHPLKACQRLPVAGQGLQRQPVIQEHVGGTGLDDERRGDQAQRLGVTHVLAEHYGSVSATHAALLVRAYGPHFVEDVVDSLFQYLDRECGEAGERLRGIAIRWFCREGLAWCDEHGCPYPNDVEDWLDTHSEPRVSLHRYVRHVKSYTRNR